MKTYPEFTLTGGTMIYPSSVVIKFPFKMQGKEVKRILTVKQWLELKEAEIYQKWYNENVAPGNTIPDKVPDEIRNLKTLTVEGASRPIKMKWTIKINNNEIQKVSDWLDESDDGI